MQGSTIVNHYRKWIIQRGTEAFPVTENEEGNLEIESKYALGRVNFYDQDLIELRIDTIRDNQTEFFLHFQLTNLQRGKELYLDMEEAMRNLKDSRITKILLSCTSGLTTSYYAELLNKAAQTLSLKYEFKAVSFDKLEKAAVNQDMILLAPQVHYMRQKVQDAFPNALVRNIPAQTFGKYDTGALIEVIQGELKEALDSRTPKYERTQSFFETTKKILTIGYLNGGIGENSSILYRYYKNGDIVFSGEVKRRAVDIEDIIEIVDPMLEKFPEIEIIGLSLPGAIENGVVNLPNMPIHQQNVQEILKEKYHREVFAFNDANMIVTGIYWLEDRYKSLLLYFLPNTISNAGCGIVVNGHLIRGRQHVAGEVKYTQNVLNLSKPAAQLLDTEEGTVEMIAKTLVTMIATVGPDAIFVYAEKLTNVDALQENIAKYIDTEFIPPIHHVENVREYMMTGTFLRCIWRMDDLKRATFGLTHNPFQ